MDFSQSFLQQPAQAPQQQFSAGFSNAQQQQQQQQQQAQGAFSGFPMGSLPDGSQQGTSAASAWFPTDAGFQTDFQVQNFSSAAVDAGENLTTWTPSYASVGGDGFASAYSASLADIAEEGDANFGFSGHAQQRMDSAVAYDPLISDTYDVPQLNQSGGGMSGGRVSSSANSVTMDFNTLLGGTGGWSVSGQTQGNDVAMGTGQGGGPSDAGQSSAFISSHASPAESGLSPGASSASAYPESGKGLDFTSGVNTSAAHVPVELVASWARSGSYGQDNLNNALKQVHISDDSRYQPVFAEDNETQGQSGSAEAAGGRADQLRASLPTLNTSMPMDIDLKAFKGIDLAAALATWASTQGGLPSPAATQAIQRAAAFGESLSAPPGGSGEGQSSSLWAQDGKTQGLTLQTSDATHLGADQNTLSAKLRDLTPVDGTFDRRSLAQPMRSESFEKIKCLINEGRMFSPATTTNTGAAAFDLSAAQQGGAATSDDSAGKSASDSFFLQLFSSIGMDAAQSQAALEQLQKQAQGGKESEQAQAQAHLAVMGLVGQGMGMGELSTNQWEQMGLKGFDDQHRIAAAQAVLGHDLTVMPIGLTTSDTRTQIGDGANAAEGGTAAGNQVNGGQTLDPSLLENSRDSTLGPMRQRNWSSSGRARPFGMLGGAPEPYRSQGQGADAAGPSYLGGSSAHPYGTPESLRRSASERNSQRRHRRAAKSEDITRLAQEGTADYVSRITSQDGKLAPPSFPGAAGMGMGTTSGPSGGMMPAVATQMGNPQALYASASTFPAQYHNSPQASLSPPAVGTHSDGSPSADGSRSGGGSASAGSPATTWTGSPSGGSGQASNSPHQQQHQSFAQMHAVTSSAAAQLVAGGAGGLAATTAMPGMMPAYNQQPPPGSLQPLQYSQTAAPMYGHLSGPNKGVHAGMLPPEMHGYGGMLMAGPGGYGMTNAGPMPGPANHVSAATQAASAARRKTEATFECPIPGCGSTFTRKNNLDGHLRSHNNERPFACPVPGCDKRFARRHDMNRHHDLHMNKKQHVCELCQRRFARLDALNRHLKNTNGTCAALGGGGEDEDEQEGGITEPPNIVPSSSAAAAASASDGSKMGALVAEPASTTGGVEVAISAPTPNFDQQLQELVAEENSSGSGGAQTQAQIPILVTPSRQNSGASSGGGGSGARFRGHVL
ncbi:hypothetical protein OC842_000578 [Tilletia horrida]|uniref:C2H2-type domain-containing protein n=1 Tax=Tilletia horrida TaxID=155126 RepID=A0AAN6GGK8_9BASI|nr:hypothetical protein OC842_000578 [Tilletia horrida]KAK0563536.1 hypothetical protein OC844_002168 [Tilletia horrida]